MPHCDLNYVLQTYKKLVFLDISIVLIALQTSEVNTGKFNTYWWKNCNRSISVALS